MCNVMFHTYVDFTIDGKAYYVGMGDDARVARKFGRNRHHTHTSKKYGQIRRVIASFENRQDAVDLEIKLIGEHHTFVDDPLYNKIGCNYTTGGEGRPCSDAMKQKMRDVIKAQYANGRKPWNKGKQGIKYNVSEEDRQKARERLIAFNKTLPNLGKRHSEETKNRMRKLHTCSTCKAPGHTKTTCPERLADATNLVAEAQKRRWDRFKNLPDPPGNR